MDYNNSMDDLIKRDKKLGRAGRRQPATQQSRGGAQAPLPGRGRGAPNNVQRAQAQPRIRQNPNQIVKDRQRPQGQQQRNPPMNNNQTSNLNQNQRRNQRGKQSLMGNQNTNQPIQNPENQTGGVRRRQMLNNLRQNQRQGARRAPRPVNQNPNVQRNAGTQQLRRRMPQAPVVNAQQNVTANRAQRQQQNNQGQQLSRTLSVVQGTLQERKIKVRNIDARVVSVQDLQKLFGKCGPLISATFDTNEFGSYLGTATVIYSRASSATRAIKEYHMARIDQRPMKVQFAMQNQQANPQAIRVQKAPSQAQVQPRANNMPGRRQTNNRIAKTGQGKTLNVAGQGRQRNQRNRRQRANQA